MMKKHLSFLTAVIVAASLNPGIALSQSRYTGNNIGKKLTASVHVDHALSGVNHHDGAMTVLVDGGTAPYSIFWSNRKNKEYISGLAAGVYTVKVRDARGVEVNESAEIEQFNCATASCQFRTQTQGGWGAVPSGNNPGVYLHANFAAAFPGGLVVGCTNTLTLTNAQAVTDFLPSGSTASALTSSLVDPAGSYSNVLAGQVVALTLNVGFDNYDPSFGVSVASLGSLVVANGTFSGMTVQQVLDEANKVLGGCASPYSASALNDAATAINESFDDGTVNTGYLLCPQSNPPDAQASATDESCFESCDGTASVVASGGNQPYSYAWSNGATTDQLSGLCSGAYSVVVTDALGCTADAQTSVDGPLELLASASSSNADCIASNGSVSVLANGGTEPYSYLWTPSGATGASVNNLPAGNYSVLVTDAHGCTADAQAEIGLNQSDLAASASATDVTCYGDADGTVHVIVSGGSGPFAYAWSPSVSNTEDASSLAPGTYHITVTDQYGCEADAEAEVTQPDLLVVAASSTDANCLLATGSASAQASGGTQPYAYLWSPSGGTSATAQNLATGIYTILVTDAHGCTAQSQVQVESEGLELSLINVTDASCPGMEDGSATVVATGGDDPYTYLWTPVGGTGATATGLTQGIYTVRVEDYLGCVAYIDVEINLISMYCNSRLADQAKSGIQFDITPTVAYSTIQVSSSSVEMNDAAAGIYTLDGRKVLDKQLKVSKTNAATIEISGLAPGIYIVSIESQSVIHKYRIVKE